MLAVRADAADDGREVDHHVRLRVGEGAADAVLGAEVVIAAARDENGVGRDAGVLQARDDVAAEEARAAGDHDAFAVPVPHG